MTRLTIALVAAVATLATCSELTAQRRTPLRNFARNLGTGWGSGYHVRNPGPAVDYYSAWSDANTPRHVVPGSGAEGPGYNDYFESPADSESHEGELNQIPSGDPGIQDDSAIHWRWQVSPGNESAAGNTAPIIRLAPDSSQSSRASQSNELDDDAFETNQWLNRHMQPWRPAPPSSQRPSVNEGQFRPATNIQNSNPWIPDSTGPIQPIQQIRRNGR
jgi:hypothetical protein